MKKIIVGLIVALALAGVASADGANLTQYTGAVVDGNIQTFGIINLTLGVIWDYGDTVGTTNANSIAQIMVNNTMVAKYSNNRTKLILQGATHSRARSNIESALKGYADNVSILVGCKDNESCNGNYGSMRLTKEQNVRMTERASDWEDGSYDRNQAFAIEATGIVRGALPFYIEIQKQIQGLLGIAPP